MWYVARRDDAQHHWAEWPSIYGSSSRGGGEPQNMVLHATAAPILRSTLVFCMYKRCVHLSMSCVFPSAVTVFFELVACAGIVPPFYFAA